MTAEDENAALVHAAVEAWNQRDIDGMRVVAWEDVEYVNSPGAVEPGTRHGHEGLELVVRTQWEMLPDTVQTVEQMHHRDDGQVLTVGRVSRSMPDSDMRIDQALLASWTVRDGKLSRIEILGFGPEVPDALVAAGL